MNDGLSQAESPLEFFRRNEEKMVRGRQKEAQEIQDKARNSLCNLASAVFFYPACGVDFEYALSKFAGRCSKFIFCDWSDLTDQSAADWIARVRRLEHFHFVAAAPLDRQKVTQLADMSLFLERRLNEPNVRHYLENAGTPSGHYAEFAVEFPSGGPSNVEVIFLAMEAVNLYVKLFTEKQTAPEILCIKNWGHIGGEWTSFGDWTAHLGQAVRESGRWPTYLIAQECSHDWPYPIRVERFPDWDDGDIAMWRRSAGADQ